MRADEPKPADAKPKIDPAQTRLAKEFKYNAPLLAGRFDPSGKSLFVASQDFTIQRIDLGSGKLAPMAGHDSWVRALAFHPRDPLVFSGGYDGKLIYWPAEGEAPKPSRVIEAHQGWLRAVAVSPDGATVASCGNDGLVKLWSAADGSATATLKGHDCHVYNLAFHPGGKSLVSADLKGVVKEWDLAKGTVAREFDAKALYKYDPSFRADIGGIRAISFSSDGNLLACGGITDVSNAFAGVGKPAVVIVDWATGKSRPLVRPKEEFQGVVWGLAFHPDGFLIGAGAGSGSAMWFWKPDQAQSFFTFKLPNNARDLTLHPDGTRVAVPCFDNVVRLYDLTAKA